MTEQQPQMPMTGGAPEPQWVNPSAQAGAQALGGGHATSNGGHPAPGGGQAAQGDSSSATDGGYSTPSGTQPVSGGGYPAQHANGPAAPAAGPVATPEPQTAPAAPYPAQPYAGAQAYAPWPQYTPSQPYSQAQPYGGPAIATVKTNTLAIVGICLAGAGFLLGLGFAIFALVALTGAILGFVALTQIKTSHEKGHGLAITAIVVGLSGFVLVGILYLLMFSLAIAFY